MYYNFMYAAAGSFGRVSTLQRTFFGQFMGFRSKLLVYNSKSFLRDGFVKKKKK